MRERGSEGFSLKKRLKNGENIFGTFVTVDSAIMIEAASLGGMDFVIIDMEHGPLEIRDIERLIPSAMNANITPIVRVGKNDEWMILRALDIGATGVQVPQINCRADGEAVIRAAKYTPLGERGISTITRAGKLNTRGQDYFKPANEETLIIVHLEGTEGVKNLDDILLVESIDVIFIGPYDLSQSLGLPGQTDHPKVTETIQNCTKKILASGKVAGAFAKDIPTANRWLDLGIQYIAVSVDALVYKTACEEIIKSIRK